MLSVLELENCLILCSCIGMLTYIIKYGGRPTYETLKLLGVGKDNGVLALNEVRQHSLSEKLVKNI